MLRSVLVLVALFCCSFAVNAAFEGSSEYFPQHVGDEHVYIKTGRLAGENNTWTDRITDKVGTAFVHTNYFGDGNQRALKVNKKGNVVEKSQGGRFIWYKFNSGESAEWIMTLGADTPPCVNGARVRVVSRNETVTVPAGTFTNVLLLEFTNNCADAGIAQQWFAPRVGLIKQSEITIGGPLDSELISAKVGKRVYPAR